VIKKFVWNQRAEKRTNPSEQTSLHFGKEQTMLKNRKVRIACCSVLLMALTGIIEYREQYREEHQHIETARQFEPTNNRIETEIRPGVTGELHATLKPLSMAAAGEVS